MHASIAFFLAFFDPISMQNPQNQQSQSITTLPSIQHEGFLVGHLLIAMPEVHDMRFAESVVLMFEHDEEGSMGIIINRRIRGLNVAALLNQLEVPFEAEKFKHPAYFGGPVSSQSGFVVHSPDYHHESMVFLQDKAGCTSSVSILHALAAGKGPAEYLVCLGQAKWVSGQLENELRQNVWLTLPFDTDIVFNCPDEKKWLGALTRLGVRPEMLFSQPGTA